MARRRSPSTLLLGALVVGGLLSGCVSSPRSAHTVGQVAAAGLWTAAVAGRLAVLSHHDGHQHHEQCGHYRRWASDRWVYYYGGHWEYYDASSGSWYYYSD